MKPQPQPPERRALHRADDPSSVLRDAEIPYGYHVGNIQRAALYETDILQLLLFQALDPESLLAQLQSHMPETDINSLRHVLADIQQRIGHRERF